MNSLTLDQSLAHSQTDATTAFIYFANFKKAEKTQIKFFYLLAAKTKAAAMNGKIKGQERIGIEKGETKITTKKKKNVHHFCCTTSKFFLVAANGEINQSGSQINRKKERKKTPARANI